MPNKSKQGSMLWKLVLELHGINILRPYKSLMSIQKSH